MGEVERAMKKLIFFLLAIYFIYSIYGVYAADNYDAQWENDKIMAEATGGGGGAPAPQMIIEPEIIKEQNKSLSAKPHFSSNDFLIVGLILIIFFLFGYKKRKQPESTDDSEFIPNNPKIKYMTQYEMEQLRLLKEISSKLDTLIEK